MLSATTPPHVPADSAQAWPIWPTFYSTRTAGMDWVSSTSLKLQDHEMFINFPSRSIGFVMACVTFNTYIRIQLTDLCFSSCRTSYMAGRSCRARSILASYDFIQGYVQTLCNLCLFQGKSAERNRNIEALPKAAHGITICQCSRPVVPTAWTPQSAAPVRSARCFCVGRVINIGIGCYKQQSSTDPMS